MSEENDINPLNSLLTRKKKLLNLKKRAVARNRTKASNKTLEHEIRLNSSDSTNSIIDNSYSDPEFEIENISNFITPTTVKSTSDNNTSEYSVKKTSSINSKKITIISEKIIKKPCFKISEYQSTTNTSRLSEDLETTIKKNIKYPDLKEFDEKITVELLEKLSSSEDNIIASSIDQSSFFDVRDVTDIVTINRHDIDALNENVGSSFEKSNRIVACSDNVNEPAEDAESTTEAKEQKIYNDDVKAPAEDAESTPETKEEKSCSDGDKAPAEDSESTLVTKEKKSCSDGVNAPADDSESTPETKEDKTCSDDVNAPAEDAVSTPEAKGEKSCSDDINAPDEDSESSPKTKEDKTCSNDVNAPTEDGESTPETKEEKSYSNGVNALADNSEPTPETKEDKTCGDDVNAPSEDAESRPETEEDKFTKYCIDFILPEDLGDFSDGSSDLWSPKDSDSNNSTDEEKKRKKKLLKKLRQKKKKNEIKEQVPPSIKKQKRENQVKKRKELKEKGFSYETSSGKIKEPRRLKENPCKGGKCSRKCFEIPEERRQSLFNYFWSLTDQQKKEFVVHCTRRQTIKRKKTDAAMSRRSKTYDYFINEGEGTRQVCQQFLINTLDISQTYLLYNASNIQEGIFQQDQRRRYAVNKYDETTKKFAKDYIEGLPALPSHYSRKKSSRLFLPQEFKNLSNLYRLYKNHCENEKVTFLSERLFTNLFRTEYNIAFHIPKKDKCKFCVKYENTEVKTLKELEAYKIHEEEKDASYKRCKIHRKLVSKTILVASFDLQKVLNTPHGESMILYYSRKYTVFNLTVYESKTQNGYCYTWGEADGKRGSAEIGTCLHKYLKTVDTRGIKYLILYCDSCGGQNKNKVILSVLRNFLETSINLEVIQINYLLPGHTYMPVDSMHSVIEREVRKIIVWSPIQWPTLMLTARKQPRPYEVNVLDHTDFIDWQIKANEIFTAETVSNKDLKIKDLRVVTFKKQNLDIMEVKYTMKENGDTYKIPLKLAERQKQNKTKGKGVGKGKSNRNENVFFDETSAKLYPTRLPISSLKYKDLKKLCEDGTIPKIYHKDYLTLPYDTQVVDTVSENEEEEEILENADNSTFGNESTQGDENIPYFDNIPDKMRKRRNTKELKENQETTPQKRIKIMPKKLDKDYEKARQIKIKSTKELKENKEATPERQKNIVPKIIDIIDDKKKRKVVTRQGCKGRGRGRCKGK